MNTCETEDTTLVETPPLCSAGCGMMVPIEREFAYIPNGDGVVTALVEWVYVEKSSRIETYVYALMSEAYPDDIPRVGDERMGERIQEMRDSGTLVEFYHPKKWMFGFYRIDDDREGQAMSYCVWHGAARLPGISMVPDAIYGLFIDGEPDPEQTDDFPSAMPPEVLAMLLEHYGIAPITRYEQLEGLVNSEGNRLEYLTDEMVHNGKVRVWDIGALYRRNSGPQLM